MSYEIFYDKQFIRIPQAKEDKFLPIIYCGSNNCYEVSRSHRGKERRARSWWNDTYITKGKPMATEKEIMERVEEIKQNIIDRNNEYLKENPDWDVYSDDKFGYFSSITMYGKHTGNTTFGMYKGFYKTGIKKALTLEELAEFNVFATIKTGYYSDKDLEKIGRKPFHYTVKTTIDLIKRIGEAEEYLKDTKVNFFITIDADEYKMKEIRRKKFPRRKKEKQAIEVDHFFTIYVKNYGYFARKTKYGFKYSYSPYKKYLTEKEAQKVANKLSKRLSYDVEVKRIDSKTTIYK